MIVSSFKPKNPGNKNHPRPLKGLNLNLILSVWIRQLESSSCISEIDKQTPMRSFMSLHVWIKIFTPLNGNFCTSCPPKNPGFPFLFRTSYSITTSRIWFEKCFLQVFYATVMQVSCDKRAHDLLKQHWRTTYCAFPCKHCYISTLCVLRSGGFVFAAMLEACVWCIQTVPHKKFGKKYFKHGLNWLRRRLTLNSCKKKLTQVIKLEENKHWWELRVFGLDLLL